MRNAKFCPLNLALRERPASAPVHVAAVGDSRDDYKALGIVDGVDDAVVAYADAVVVAPGQLHRSPRPRVGGEGVDGGTDSIS